MKKNKNQTQLSSKICIDRYNRNMQALEKADLNLHKRVKSYNDKKSYNIVADKNNEIYNLYIKDKKKYYYEENNLLYNVKLKIDELKLKNSRMAIFLGMGLGYELLYFLKDMSKVQNAKKIIVIERDIEIFKYALHSVELEKILMNENIVFLVDRDQDEIARFFEDYFRLLNTITLIKAVGIIHYPTSLELYGEYYLDAVKTYREMAKYSLSFFGNSPDDSLIGLRHMFDNINEILDHPGINMLYDAFKGKPAVVVASGPSLTKQIEKLKKIKDKVVIISANSTLKILLSHGIKPHIVAALERVPETKETFSGLEASEVEDVFLAACPVIPNDAYEVYKGPRLVVYREFDHFKWLEVDKGMLSVKLSSANMAFKIGEALGCDPVILIGQDLSFAEDNETTHVPEHIFGANQENYVKSDKIPVKGNVQETVYTTSVWLSFLKAYEVDIRMFNGTCINATEGGAFIHGAKIMTFDEAITQYVGEAIDPIDVIRKEISSFKYDDREELYSKLAIKLEQSIDDVNTIIGYAEEGKKLITDNRDYLMVQSIKTDFTEEEKEKIKKIFDEAMTKRKSMLDIKDTFQILIMHIVQPIYIKYEIDLNEIPSRHDELTNAYIEMLNQMVRWFAVIMEVIVIIKEELEATRVKLIL